MIKRHISLNNADITIAEAIKGWTSDYQLKTVTPGVLRAPSLYTGFLPRMAAGREEDPNLPFFPYILVRLCEGEDINTGGTFTTEIKIGIYDNDMLNAGFEDVKNLISNIRHGCFTENPINKLYPLHTPFKWRTYFEHPEEDYYPYFFGWITATWALPVPSPQPTSSHTF